MARIRTVKPEFFKDEDLYQAEIETGLPLRLAFEGLWVCADREGRFKWRPNTLKLDALPFDQVDFSRVMNALWTRGYLVKYAFNTQDFGCIRTWKRHQSINNKESASTLPSPEEGNIILPSVDACKNNAEKPHKTPENIDYSADGHTGADTANNINNLTRDSRVDYALSTPLEGKGREGKGKERKDISVPSGTLDQSVQKKIISRFDDFWDVYPRKENKKKSKDIWKRKKLDLKADEIIADVINRKAKHLPWQDKKFIPHPTTYLNGERWGDEIQDSRIKTSSSASKINYDGVIE